MTNIVLFTSLLLLVVAVNSVHLLSLFELEQFNKETLKGHNVLRRKHGVNSLQLNNQLTKLAQQVAEQSAYNDNYEMTRPTYKGKIPGAMYAKVSGYDHFDGFNLSNLWYTSHDKNGKRTYAQVIWKSSRIAGFGKATSTNGKTYMVGFYYPAGNVIGQEKENILPLVAETTTHTTNNRPYGPGPVVTPAINVKDNTISKPTQSRFRQKLSEASAFEYNDNDYLYESERKEVRRYARKFKQTTSRTVLLRNLVDMYEQFSAGRGFPRHHMHDDIDQIISKLRKLKRKL